MVLKVFLEKFDVGTQDYIVEKDRGMHLVFYRLGIATWGGMVLRNCITPVTWKNNRGSNEYDYGYATKYNFPRFHSMQLRLDFGPVPAKDALDRFFWFAAGEYPRGRYGRHESNEKWQGWLKDDGTRNKFLIHEMMEAVCRYKDEHRKSMIKQVHFHSNPKWQHSICACLDPDRDAELKKIEGRLRVECHSAACVGGGNNVYMFAPTNPCTTIQVCNQSVNVTAEKALLKNINLNCTISGPVTPKNTSSANEDLGSRKVPSSMMKNSVKENGNCDADYKAMVKAGTSEKIGPDHPHRCSEAAPVCSGHVKDKQWGKCKKSSGTGKKSSGTGKKSSGPVVKSSGTGGTSSSVTKHSDGSTTTTRTIGETSWDEPEATTKTFSHQETPKPAEKSKPWKPDPKDFPGEIEPAPPAPPTPEPAEESTHKTVLGIRLPRKLLGIDITIVLIIAALIIVAAFVYALKR